MPVGPPLPVPQETPSTNISTVPLPFDLRLISIAVLTATPVAAKVDAVVVKEVPLCAIMLIKPEEPNSIPIPLVINAPFITFLPKAIRTVMPDDMPFVPRVILTANPHSFDQLIDPLTVLEVVNSEL